MHHGCLRGLQSTSWGGLQAAHRLCVSGHCLFRAQPCSRCNYRCLFPLWTPSVLASIRLGADPRQPRLGRGEHTLSGRPLYALFGGGFSLEASGAGDARWGLADSAALGTPSPEFMRRETHRLVSELPVSSRVKWKPRFPPPGVVGRVGGVGAAGKVLEGLARAARPPPGPGRARVSGPTGPARTKAAGRGPRRGEDPRASTRSAGSSSAASAARRPRVVVPGAGGWEGSRRVAGGSQAARRGRHAAPLRAGAGRGAEGRGRRAAASPAPRPPAAATSDLHPRPGSG